MHPLPYLYPLPARSPAPQLPQSVESAKTALPRAAIAGCQPGFTAVGARSKCFEFSFTSAGVNGDSFETWELLKR